MGGAVDGDGGAVHVDSALHAPSGAVAQVPCDGRRREHVAAAAHGARPHRASEHVVDGHGHGGHGVGRVVRYVEIGSRARGVGVGVEVEYLRGYVATGKELDCLLGGVAGCVPHAQAQRVQAFLHVGQRIGDGASGGAVGVGV